MEVKKISLEKILIGDNIRQEIGEEKINELSESIKYQGLINPITVMPLEEDKYLIIAGFRRYFAVKKLGLKEIPCVIKKFENPFDRLIFQLQENEKREDLNNYERAITYLKLFEYFHNQNFKDEFNLKTVLSELLKNDCKYNYVVSMIGKSKKTIYRILYPLSNEVMTKFYKEYNLSPNVFEKISGIKNNKDLEKILKKIVEKNMTLKEIENEVKKKKQNKENLYKINSFINFIKKIKSEEIKVNEEEKQKLKELKELLNEF